MEFVLKQYDIPLLKFSATMDTSEPEIEILWKTSDQTALLPIDMECSGAGVSRWLRRRTIPKNRAYVHTILAKQGLNLNRPMAIIQICKGLSLNDSYWVSAEDDNATFDAVNLYENNFSRTLAWIAFTGYGSQGNSSLFSSPEFTTNGMLPKCWRRERGIVSLWKGGTDGSSNTGFEPYSEFYAAQIAQAMGLDIVPYQLSKWKGLLCSTCALFTSRDQSFIPVGHLVRTGGMEAVTHYYASLGSEFTFALQNMLIFDAVICNVDRHYGNFGFLIDNASNQITAPAPLFDHGNSLFNFAGSDCWKSDAALEEYMNTLTPSVYDDFIATAQKVLQPSQREGLRHLLNFKFKKHSRYNLPPKRLRMIETQIRKRAATISGE